MRTGKQPGLPDQLKISKNNADPDQPEVIPANTPIEDLARQELERVKAEAGSVLAGKFRAFLGFFLPGSPIPFDKIAFFAALIAVALAIPVGAKKPDSAIYFIPYMLPVVFFGWLWRSRLLGVLAIVVAVASVGGVYGTVAFNRQQVEDQKRHAEAEKLEQQRVKAEQEAAEKKAAEEKAAHEIEAEKATAAAKKAAEEAAAKRADAEFERTQAQREKERAAAAQKKADEEARAKLAAEDEEIKKKRAAETERIKLASLEKRAEQLEAAKSAFAEKTLLLEDSTNALRKLETKIRIEKDEMDTQQLVLDREKSPKPPTDQELEKARKRLAEAKQSYEKLQAQLTPLKAATDAAAKDKKKAEALVDELSK